MGFLKFIRQLPFRAENSAMRLVGPIAGGPSGRRESRKPRIPLIGPGEAADGHVEVAPVRTEHGFVNAVDDERVAEGGDERSDDERRPRTAHGIAERIAKDGFGKNDPEDGGGRREGNHDRTEYACAFAGFHSAQTQHAHDRHDDSDRGDD